MRSIRPPLEPLVLPPGHRVTITLDGDAMTMGVTVTAYRGSEWVGETQLQSIGDDGRLQAVVDQLTKRGPQRS